jgi:hypothetical protein
MDFPMFECRVFVGQYYYFFEKSIGALSFIKEE